MKKITKISLILLLVGMAVVAAVPFLKEKEAEKKSEKEFENIQETALDIWKCQEQPLVIL